jgi:hypothetical protein
VASINGFSAPVWRRIVARIAAALPNARWLGTVVATTHPARRRRSKPLRWCLGRCYSELVRERLTTLGTQGRWLVLWHLRWLVRLCDRLNREAQFEQADQLHRHRAHWRLTVLRHQIRYSQQGCYDICCICWSGVGRTLLNTASSRAEGRTTRRVVGHPSQPYEISADTA